MRKSQTQQDQRGPTPLHAHLLSAGSEWVSAVAAYHAALANTIPWHESLEDRAQKLMGEIKAEDYAHIGRIIARQADERLQSFLKGVEQYQCCKRAKAHTLPPVVKSWGNTTLHDYGLHEHGGGKGHGRSVLFIPSLVNPAHVLDLSAENSLLRYLSKHGHHPYLLNWGMLDDQAREYDLDAYISNRLIPAIEFLNAKYDAPVPLVGYCMGGNLAFAAAAIKPDLISGLGLLATPWDFHADGDAPAKLFAQFAKFFDPIMKMEGALPAHMLQLVFASLDPTLVERKFRRFSCLDPECEEAQAFIALEDWANSGPPLAAGVAHNVFQDWYYDNRPAQNTWTIAGHCICPDKFEKPVFALVPENDRIVPPKSALALADALHAKILRPTSGHVGMIIGRRAKRECWQPLSDWLTSI